MSYNIERLPIQRYLRIKTRLLEDFGIHITKDISDRISDLYPDDTAVCNYTRTLIKKHLSDDRY